MMHLSKIEWVSLIGLLLLSLVPCVGGIFRLLELGFGTAALPVNPRIQIAPLPVVLHIFMSVLFCILGAFQFLPSIRVRQPRWHRLVGRALVCAGVISAITGIWMAHYYDFSDDLQGELLYVVRLIVGFAMVIFLLQGLAEILKKRFVSHQAWMIRAYALGQGAGTQVIITLPFILSVGQPTGFIRDLIMTLGWLINIFFAEKVIRIRKNIKKEANESTPIQHS